MPTIKILPENLMNQIAAGEVIERPASVVKELLENSLDAGATHITIEVQDGGDTFLRLTDDGIGMDKEDAVLALERHATSKIASAEDLFNIRTLGFRGEALASIASVSYLLLQTKKRGETEGTMVKVEGGKVEKVKSVGVPEGTQIEIKQLFYNTPARKKYLKNSVTEYNHIFNAVSGLALSFPRVAFQLVHNDKIVFDLPAAPDYFTRIRALMGKTLADELIPVFYGHTRIQLEGFIGKPMTARSNRNGQYLFVNNREVKSHVLSYAVKESYYSLLPKEKYPVFFLYFTIDPQLIDVNVHPRKLEVRFQDEREIFRITTQACQKALQDHVLAPKILGNDSVSLSIHRQQSSLEKNARADSEVQKKSPLSPELVAAALSFTEKFSGEHGDEQKLSGSARFSSPAQPFASLDPALLREKTAGILPLAQLANSYILCQQNEELVIIDQHAAHERIRYTELVAEFEHQQKQLQPLLTPLQLELSQSDINALEQNKDLFQNLGFEIESFGGATYTVQSVPAYLAKENIQKTVLGLLDDLSSQTQKGNFQKRKERSLIFMACRTAKKFGDPLTAQEQRSLIDQLMTLDLPYTCPHGRPTMVTLSFEELKKRFKRDYRD